MSHAVRDGLHADPEFRKLLTLSARQGRDPARVQAAGGNTSLKVDDTLWIKASGKWLADALDADIFVPVRLGALRDALARHDPAAEKAQSFVSDAANPDGRRPSIETTVHAAMPQRVVVHVHRVETIAHAVLVDARYRLGVALAYVAWAWVPYVRPGRPLARAVEDACTARARRGRRRRAGEPRSPRRGGHRRRGRRPTGTRLRAAGAATALVFRTDARRPRQAGERQRLPPAGRPASSRRRARIGRAGLARSACRTGRRRTGIGGGRMNQLEIAGVTKVYDPKTRPVTAVDALDLVIAPGDIVALPGSSGCGKTSTLRRVAGFEERGQTAILVTHDQTEADALGDRVRLQLGEAVSLDYPLAAFGDPVRHRGSRARAWRPAPVRRGGRTGARARTGACRMKSRRHASADR